MVIQFNEEEKRQKSMGKDRKRRKNKYIDHTVYTNTLIKLKMQK